jgi:hypothetical protein
MVAISESHVDCQLQSFNDQPISTSCLVDLLKNWTFQSFHAVPRMTKDTKALNSTGFTEPISWTMPLQKKSVSSPGHDGFDDGFGAISPHDILFMTSSHINKYYYII